MSNGFHTLVSVAVFAAMLIGTDALEAASSGKLIFSAPVASSAQKSKIPTRPQISDHELYTVSFSSLRGRPPLNEMHGWQVTLVDRDGTPVTGAQIALIGGLRDRPHSLPTSPRQTRDFGDGRYLVEGIKFDRHGWWRLKLEIHAAGNRETVSFDVPVGATVWADWSDEWSEDERAAMKSLWIGSLPKSRLIPSNKVADNQAAAEFGHRLFFDTRLSQDGSVACATCHIPELAFTDGRKLAVGIGQTGRNAPTIIGAAYSPWLFWDGRKDSLWSQALAPFENPVEHGTTRAKVLAVVRQDADYSRRYQHLFGPLPKNGDRAGISRAFANLGKSIAAYERAILPGPSKFDRYVEAILNDRKPSAADQLNIEEMAGLRAFISDNQGQCLRCHNGPMFTDNHFHNIGSQEYGANENEQGRATGIILALADGSNCRSDFSDAPREGCAELEFAKRRGPELVGAFKTPSLRFLPKTAPYMHIGQYQSLEDVIWHYRDVPPATIGESELHSLSMSDAQFRQIEDFLRTLDGPIAAPEHFLRPPD
jgi:cytochrome c peroxidase